MDMRGGGCGNNGDGPMYKCTGNGIPSVKADDCSDCKLNWNDPAAGPAIECGGKSYPTFLGRPGLD